MSVLCIPTVGNVFSVEVGGNETQFTLRELQPNQAYRLRIAAGTGIGFGVSSEWAQHQTLAHYNQSDSSMGKDDHFQAHHPAIYLDTLFLLKHSQR